MTKTLFAALAILALSGALAKAAEPPPAPQPVHSGFPVDIVVPKPPAPVVADARVRLLYELRVTNLYSGPVELARVEVRGPKQQVLSTLAGPALAGQLQVLGAAPDDAATTTLGGGRTALVFVDLALPPGTPAPSALSHAVTFQVRTPDGRTLEREVFGVTVPVGAAAPVIGPPLAGGGWVAANGLTAPDHRRSVNPVDGRAHMAQRLAIDWARLSSDGRFFTGDRKINASYPAYGTPVLAVADARVAAVVDGLPDNDGDNPQSSRTVTLDNITGNSIVLDLGNGRYALYAHLIPGSLKVRPGARVRRGQTLARLGNSGNSDAPHLHFQLMDAPSPLGAEGVPYALEAFTEHGVLDDLSGLETGAAWRPAPDNPAKTRRAEFALDRAVVDFGPEPRR